MAARNIGVHKGTPVTRGTIKSVRVKRASSPTSVVVHPTGHFKVSADKMTSHFRASVNASVINQQEKGLPVARYDTGCKKAYLEFPDGRKQYID